ncbi:tumor necrosis factor receptor superfamily member22 [Striga asiatica]|uniref:Tumor necrosis factor receptor superfamily member22 n=1 Tax=Striga asiatica TaxID=4170 RepID=A0A5A7Q1I2_STRAF|nr:tumor necrosis factor receptor superfamily member22 [Striga asiatica]
MELHDSYWSKDQDLKRGSKGSSLTNPRQTPHYQDLVRQSLLSSVPSSAPRQGSSQHATALVVTLAAVFLGASQGKQVRLAEQAVARDLLDEFLRAGARAR